jgi:hypothetical protein
VQPTINIRSNEVAYIFTITPKDNLDKIELEEFQDEMKRTMCLMLDILNKHKEDFEASLEETNEIKISLSSSSNLESLPITLEECKKVFKEGHVFSELFNPYDRLAEKVKASLG